MLRLLKYELRKTLFAKLVLLAITVIAEAVFLYGFWGDHERPMVIGAVLLFFIAIAGVAMMGILSLVTLHRDMNTKQGYMLFMTPNSCYKILGAKVIECGISLMLAGAFFLGLGMLDFRILLGNEVYNEVWSIIEEMFRLLRIQITAGDMIALVFYMLASWLCTITTAYLADVICSSLMNGQKWTLLLTFGIFLVLNYLISWIISLISVANNPIMTFLWQGLAALGLSGVMYVITARLMEKYLSV